MDGWIKLHRKLLSNPVVCKDSDHLAVWIYLLLNATHSEHPAIFGGNKITLQPGQLITGRKSIASEQQISESKVERILKSFQIEHQIEQQTSNKNRLISILSWAKYQLIEQQDEQQLNNKRTTTEQQVDTNKNVKKEKNERKKEVKTYTSDFDSFWDVYPRKIGKQEAFTQWNTAIKSDEPSFIISCATNYASSCEQTEVQYIKHPKTFLSKERYRDYQLIVMPQSPKSAWQRKQDVFAKLMQEAEERDRERTGSP